MLSPFDNLIVNVGDIEKIDDVDAKETCQDTSNDIEAHIGTLLEGGKSVRQTMNRRVNKRARRDYLA